MEDAEMSGQSSAVWHCKLQSQKLGFQVRMIMRSRPGQPELHSKALSQKPKSGLGVWCMSRMCEGLFLVPRIQKLDEIWIYV